MQQINVSDWEQFEHELRTIQSPQAKVQGRRRHVSDFLYRGQSDARWKLTTTLERHDCGNLSLVEYYAHISSVKPQIESLTDTKWRTRSLPVYAAQLTEHDHMAVTPKEEEYEYMVYLRHHGFPSPLLDWTRSPYVGAYFAFRHARQDVKDVAIFVYREYIGHGKSVATAGPHTRVCGPHIRTHRRHFLQQSDYTVCTQYSKEWRYAPHEDAFARANPKQDALWKFSIPSTERLKVLRLLDQFNLNGYSLFGTTETLMETLAFRKLEAR